MEENNGSKLVEQAQESVETQDFDASAFLGTSETAQAAEESQEGEIIAESDNGDVTWDSIETESTEVVDENQEEAVDDWDVETPEAVVEEELEEAQTEEVIESQEFDWTSMSDELGFDVSSKEDVIAEINRLKEAAENPVVQSADATLTEMGKYIEMDDRELIAADLKAEGLEEYDIEESIEAMTNSGQLKKQAAVIRREIKKAMENHKQKSKEDKGLEEAERSEMVKSNRMALQNELKGFNEFLGVKVSKNQAKDLYGYIKEGNFMKEALSTHRNVIEAAFLFSNRDKLAKIIRSKAFEEGKTHILDQTTNPSLNRTSKPDYKIQSDGFNVSEFMKGL